MAAKGSSTGTKPAPLPPPSGTPGEGIARRADPQSFGYAPENKPKSTTVTTAKSGDPANPQYSNSILGA
jgi:hypothetical protein